MKPGRHKSSLSSRPSDNTNDFKLKSLQRLFENMEQSDTRDKTMAAKGDPQVELQIRDQLDTMAQRDGVSNCLMTR